MNVNGINVNGFTTAQQVKLAEQITNTPDVTAQDSTAVKPEGQTDTEGEVAIDENQAQEGTKGSSLKELIQALLEAIKEMFGANKAENKTEVDKGTSVDKADNAAEDKDFNLTDKQEAYIQLYGDKVAEMIAKERIGYKEKYDKPLFKHTRMAKEQQARLEEAIKEVSQDDIEAYVKLNWAKLSKAKK